MELTVSGYATELIQKTSELGKDFIEKPSIFFEKTSDSFVLHLTAELPISI